jgi:hypothetical protein
MFPNGRFDDQVDSTAHALAWTKQRPSGRGIFDYYRLLAERARPAARIPCWCGSACLTASRMFT